MKFASVGSAVLASSANAAGNSPWNNEIKSSALERPSQPCNLVWNKIIRCILKDHDRDYQVQAGQWPEEPTFSMKSHWIWQSAIAQIISNGEWSCKSSNLKSGSVEVALYSLAKACDLVLVWDRWDELKWRSRWRWTSHAKVLDYAYGEELVDEEGIVSLDWRMSWWLNVISKVKEDMEEIFWLFMFTNQVQISWWWRSVKIWN